MESWLSRKNILLLPLLTIFFYYSQIFADSALLKQKQTQQYIKQIIHQHHFDKNQLTKILLSAKYQPQIIESMERPYEKKTWDIYKRLFLTNERVQAGLAFWKNNQEILLKAEREFGVSPEVIVAILGVETIYGKHQGNYRVLDALTTLAFYYPKRAEFFKKELTEFLLLCREHHVAADQYMGSYAGAMGKPQFMPSSYRFYAVGFNSKKYPDLMHHDADVIASVANYFNKHGWKKDEVVVDPAEVDNNQLQKFMTNTKVPNYRLEHLIANGIKPIGKTPNLSTPTGIIELINVNKPEYWLAYPNFYVITRYNSSPQYAMAVYLLAQQLHDQWLLTMKAPNAQPKRG